VGRQSPGYFKEYYAANKDKLKAKAAEWRLANPRSVRTHSLSRYGITADDFDAMLSQQNGSCAICSTEEPGGKGSFHVDHCHATGVVRALLCNKCNVGLGSFGDSPERLIKAASYIKQHQQEAA